MRHARRSAHTIGGRLPFGLALVLIATVLSVWPFAHCDATDSVFRNLSTRDSGDVYSAKFRSFLDAGTGYNEPYVVIDGAVTTSPPANASVNVSQYGGSATVTGTGASGAGIPRVTVANDSNVLVTQAALTKGTQGSAGVSTQDLKDAGRTFVTFNADQVAGVTGNTILTFSKNVGNTVTGSVTSYTITSGKTFRIQHITVAVRSAAAAIAFSKVYLRMNSGGATVATSNIIWSTEINNNNATSGTGAWSDTDFPDGLEITGDGTKSIGISHLDQATTNLISVTLVGYEY